MTCKKILLANGFASPNAMSLGDSEKIHSFAYHCCSAQTGKQVWTLKSCSTLSASGRLTDYQGYTHGMISDVSNNDEQQCMVVCSKVHSKISL
jgi:hypothetical protein